MRDVGLTKRKRAAILDRELEEYLSEGWRIQARTDTQVQLLLPARGKSGCLVIILLLLGILPGIIYLMWPSRDQLVTLTVDETGEVHEQYAKG